MKDGQYASYHGNIYAFGRDQNNQYILRSSNIDDVKDGFERCEPFIYKKTNELIVCIKRVSFEELDEFFVLRTKANYSGHPFIVMDENDEEVMLVATSGDYRTWIALGMNQLEKGVYQKWVKRDETEITQNKYVLGSESDLGT